MINNASTHQRFGPRRRRRASRTIARGRRGRRDRRQRGASPGGEVRGRRRSVPRGATSCLRTPELGARGGDRGAMRRVRARGARRGECRRRFEKTTRERVGGLGGGLGGTKVGRELGGSLLFRCDRHGRFVFPERLPPRSLLLLLLLLLRVLLLRRGRPVNVRRDPSKRVRPLRGAPSFLEERWGSGVHTWTVSAATLERLREGFALGDPRRVLAGCSDPADPNGGAFAPERTGCSRRSRRGRGGARGAGAAGGGVRGAAAGIPRILTKAVPPPSPRDAYAAADSKSKSNANANANAHPSRRRRGVTTTKGHRETTPLRWSEGGR